MTERVAFVAANLAHAVGPELEQDIVLLAASGAPLAAALRAAGSEAWALDAGADRGEPPAALGAAAILSEPAGQRALAEHGIGAVLPFKPSAALERAAATLGLRVLAPRAQLVRQLENKLELPAIAAAAGVPVPETERVVLGAELAERARQGRVDVPRIFQPAMGFAGAGTVVVRSAAQIEELVLAAPRSGAPGKLVHIVEGIPITVTGVVLPDGVLLVGSACTQLTGVELLTPAELGSCGNEWSHPLPEDAALEARRMAAAIGRTVATRGFLGTFGIDAVLGPNGPVLIEINPRWTASLSFQVQLQLRAGVPSLANGHLLAFGAKAAAALPELLDVWHPDVTPPPLGPGASVIGYRRQRGMAHPGELQPGVWRLDPGTGALQRCGAAVRLAELEVPMPVGAAIVLPQPPERTLARGSELLRIALPHAAVAPTGELQPQLAALVTALTAQLDRPAA